VLTLDIDSILPFTEFLVESNWPIISILATHLLTYRELGYEDVVRLIQQSV
jgi:hypothetical protein